MSRGAFEQLAAAVRPDGRPHILSRHASDALQQEAEWEQEGRGSFTNTVALSEWVEEELGLGVCLLCQFFQRGFFLLPRFQSLLVH